MAVEKNLCVYEDSKYANLYPLALTRPVFELRCGIFSILEKALRHFPGYRISYCVRDELTQLYREAHPEAQINSPNISDTVFLNGRFFADGEFPKSFDKSTAFVCNGQVVGAFVLAKDMRKLGITETRRADDSVFGQLPRVDVQGTCIDYPWDLIHNNAKEIENDFQFMRSGGQILGKLYPNVTLLAQENIYLAPGSVVHPGAVIDAENGPVHISEGATIMANAVIEGPAFIGKKSRIKVGAKIYEGTSIGAVCKVGGEVEESIIHAYSNKQHDGCLGHAYLGEWVNLGADSNNSDLKNNYGTVKLHINGEMVDSGSMFVGLFMGDHSKSGINTMFNTGTAVGVMANVFGAGYTPKFIPSFAWGAIEKLDRYALDKGIETARRVMGRRKLTLSPAQEALLRQIYNRSETEPI